MTSPSLRSDRSGPRATVPVIPRMDRRTLLAALCATGAGGWTHALPRVRLDTPLGLIVLELEIDRAPLTAGRFLQLAETGAYDRGRFYRVVKPEGDTNPVPITVVEGGLWSDAAALTGIPHESTTQTGLSHTHGVVSLARAAPGTGSSEIFICIGDNRELDAGGRRAPDGQGFAAFGRVISGMETVMAIHRGAVEPGVPGSPTANQILTAPVPFGAVSRVS